MIKYLLSLICVLSILGCNSTEEKMSGFKKKEQANVFPDDVEIALSTVEGGLVLTTATDEETVYWGNFENDVKVFSKLFTLDDKPVGVKCYSAARARHYGGAGESSCHIEVHTLLDSGYSMLNSVACVWLKKTTRTSERRMLEPCEGLEIYQIEQRELNDPFNFYQGRGYARSGFFPELTEKNLLPPPLISKTVTSDEAAILKGVWND